MKSLTIFRAIALLFSLALCTGNITNAKKKQTSLSRTIAYSQASSEYHREKQANGEWVPEKYALGIGQMLDPTKSDESLSQLTLEDMAEILAKALIRENYLPETDPEETDLMIVVNWGKTIPHNDGLKGLRIDGISTAINSENNINLDVAASSAGEATVSQNSEMAAIEGELQTMLLTQDMFNRARKDANEYNALLLGFAPKLFDHYISNPLGGPQRLVLDSMVEEIEMERYFVILQAYDFKKLIHNKVKDLKWITRFSIRAKGRKFDEEFKDMTQSASSLFGSKSGKLKLNLLPGEASLGELEVIGVIDEENIKE